ncbi:MAG: hypothetical protein SNI70_10790 [Rikenellaceae bacterium]
MRIRIKNTETVTRTIEVDSEYIQAGYRHLATTYFIRATASKCIIVESYDGVAGRVSVDSARALDAKDYNYVHATTQEQFECELNKVLNAAKGGEL